MATEAPIVATRVAALAFAFLEVMLSPLECAVPVHREAKSPEMCSCSFRSYDLL